MTAIIPFESSKLPAHLAANRTPGINKDVLGSGGAQYPVLSIKGKVFTLVKGSERKVITREIDGEEEAVASLQLTVIRANTKYRVFYASAFVEGESDGKKPTCFSNDGVAPDALAAEPQSKKCQGCPQNVWGIRDGKGTACSSKTRLAVVDPTNLAEPLLLNVPAASRKSFAQAVEAAETRGIDYNALVMRTSFDKEAASPKLAFKPVGWLDAGTLAKVQALYDDELVQEMVGVASARAEHAVAAAAPAVDTGELDAAIAARKAVDKAQAPATKAPVVSEADFEQVVAKIKPTEKPKPKPVPKAAATPAVDDTDSLLADMEALLGDTDD